MPLAAVVETAEFRLVARRVDEVALLAELGLWKL